MSIIEEKAKIDYPEQGEMIVAPQYTFRLSAKPGAQKVEISVDQGSWQKCRPAVGYWWHDWINDDHGEHQARVRVFYAGKYEIGTPRWFSSEEPSEAV